MAILKFGHPSPDAGAFFQDRRRVPRYAVRWNAELFDPLHSTRLPAQVMDVSMKGSAVFALHGPIEQDTIVQLKIQRQADSLELWARVVHLTGDDKCGLTFLRTGWNEEKVLLHWLSEVQRES
jgi:PilZ domain-containing protein